MRLDHFKASLEVLGHETVTLSLEVLSHETVTLKDGSVIIEVHHSNSALLHRNAILQLVLKMRPS